MLQKQHRCLVHSQIVIKICKSPYCDHYRELCQLCALEDYNHSNQHLGWREAAEEALRLGKLGLTRLEGVRARKNQQMEENIINNPGLVELQAKLDDITKLINQKILNFRNNIQRIYSNHVREKLDELDEVIVKSEQILQRQVNQLEQRNYSNLNLFFKSDFFHEIRYYEDYFKEIFVKKIRSFKTAIENDRIFSLIINFQQNLEKIFTFEKKNHQEDKIREFHLFTNEAGQCYLYSLNQNVEKQLSTQPIAAMNRISHSKLGLPENTKYNWVSIPQSIFYPQTNCYYIIGQGNKSSRLIIKYDYLKGVDQGFKTVKYMESERKNFGVCLLNGQIYIIGGQNEKQGCLARCQKFVPLYNNQIYIIHSLRHRSSRHSVTTYKNKYILKFGGIKRMFDESVRLVMESNVVQNFNSYLAPPQIYSIETEEWSVIPFHKEAFVQFNLYPSIFKAEHRNFIIVLGGDPFPKSLPKSKNRFRPAFELVLQESKGQIEQVKVRIRQSKVQFRQRIYNSTIALLDEDHQCVFLKQKQQQALQLGRFKIEF